MALSFYLDYYQVHCLGHSFSRYLTFESFNLYFGIFLIFVAILLMVRNKIKPFKTFDKPKYEKTYVDAKGKTYHYSVPPLFAFITTFLIGILTGLFGIGGGALNDATNAYCI